MDKQQEQAMTKDVVQMQGEFLRICQRYRMSTEDISKLASLARWL